LVILGVVQKKKKKKKKKTNLLGHLNQPVQR